jgi:ABC-type nitrate/sulfonate/bicarbonate transport system substrate-binding protein
MLVTAAVTACGAGGSGADTAGSASSSLGSIKVGFSPQGVYMPMYFAVKQGFFKRQHIDASLTTFSSGVEQLNAVLTGQADISGNGQFNAPLAIEKGGHVKTIAEYAKSGHQFGAVGKDSIKAPNDLKGKVIGTQEGGSSTQYYLNRYLKLHHISKHAVTVKNIKYGQLIAALRSGSIDAFFAFQPYLDKAVKSVPHTHIFNYSGQDNVFHLHTSLNVSQKVYSDPRLAKGVLRAMIGAEKWMGSHPSEVAKATRSVVQTNTLAEAKKSTMIFTYKIDLNDETVQATRQATNFLLQQGLVKERVPARKVFDAQFLKQVSPKAVSGAL